MVVLDTDHLTLLERQDSSVSRRLRARLSHVDVGFRATTIVTYEGQTRGWMAYMARARSIAQETEAYARLKTHLLSFRNILVLDFDEGAAVEYQRLRRLRVRIGTMDLKIAAIVIANDATLLSRNSSDFPQSPGSKARGLDSRGRNLINSPRPHLQAAKFPAPVPRAAPSGKAPAEPGRPNGSPEASPFQDDSASFQVGVVPSEPLNFGFVRAGSARKTKLRNFSKTPDI